MEISLKVLIDVTERVESLVKRLTCQAPIESRPKPELTAGPKAAEAEREPTESPAPAAAPAPKPAPAPTPAPVPTPVPAPAPAPAPVADPQTGESDLPFDEPEPRKEKPEDVMPLLRQQFGIPENKDERTPEQQSMAKDLGRTMQQVIREVTTNPAARSLADLKTEADRREFIRRALLITFNTNEGKFDAKPF